MISRRALLTHGALLAAALSVPRALHAASVSQGAPSTARRVAVLYFENGGTPELDVLRLGLAQMLISDLSQEPGLVVLERTRINEVLAELELNKSAVDPATAQRAGKLLGAERLVLGAYFELLGTLRIDARVVEVETGRILGATGADGARADFQRLQDTVAKALVPSLLAGADGARSAAPQGGNEGGLKVRGGEGWQSSEGGTAGGATTASATDATASDAGAPAPSATPANMGTEPTKAPATSAATDPLGAAVLFGEALDSLDRKDLHLAKERLERALVLDPGLAEARAELQRLVRG